MSASRWTALGLLALGYGIALNYGSLEASTLIAFSLLIIAAIAVRPARPPIIRYLGHGLFITTGVALAAHWLPGFNNAPIMALSQSSPNAPPFTSNLNLDKPLIGLWLVLACPWLWQPVAPRQVIKVPLIATLLTTSLCLGLACLLGVTAWTPKWPPYALLWLANNLLLVTLTEELLFRGYVQGYVQGHLRHTLQHNCHHRLLRSILPIGLGASLFGLAHIGNGIEWVLLAGLAGVGYGLAWRYAGLWAAVVTHFALNLVHFCLFAYPMLKH